MPSLCVVSSEGGPARAPAQACERTFRFLSSVLSSLAMVRPISSLLSVASTTCAASALGEEEREPPRLARRLRTRLAFGYCWIRRQYWMR